MIPVEQKAVCLAVMAQAFNTQMAVFLAMTIAEDDIEYAAICNSVLTSAAVAMAFESSPSSSEDSCEVERGRKVENNARNNVRNVVNRLTDTVSQNSPEQDEDLMSGMLEL